MNQSNTDTVSFNGSIVNSLDESQSNKNDISIKQKDALPNEDNFYNSSVFTLLIIPIIVLVLN